MHYQPYFSTKYFFQKIQENLKKISVIKTFLIKSKLSAGIVNPLSKSLAVTYRNFKGSRLTPPSLFDGLSAKEAARLTMGTSMSERIQVRCAVVEPRWKHLKMEKIYGKKS